MKTRLLSITFLLFISSAGFSQGLSFGIKGGANLGKISGEAFKDEYTLGYHVGVFATIGLGEKIAIQPEILLSQVNVDTAYDYNQVYQFHNIGKINLQYLTIPILLNINLNNFIALQAGPQFGILMDKNKDLLENGKDAFKTQDFSLVGGVQLKLLKFRVYGRFVGGLTNLDNIGNEESWKTQTVQLGVGIAL